MRRGGKRSPEDEQFADDLDRSAAQGCAQPRLYRCAGLPVISGYPDFDQAVRRQRPVGLSDDRGSQTRIADHHDRVEMVGLGPQGFPLRGTQFRDCHSGPLVGTGAGSLHLGRGIHEQSGDNDRPNPTGSMNKRKVNRAWLARHLNDPYVKLAQKHGYRSRAAFKLIEIDEQDRLIRRGAIVVDLGSAPGAWSQVLRERLVRPRGAGLDGRIIALDMLEMEPVADVEFILGDFRELAVLEQLSQSLSGSKVDLVVSDMAPNLSGVASADSARMGDLIDLALDFSASHLSPEGVLLAKCFHGSGYSQMVERFKSVFRSVSVRKPSASRDESSETYLVGRALRGS